MTTTIFSDKEIISKLLKSGEYVLERDGWSQMKPEYFIEAGYPKSFIDPLVSTFHSDGTIKGSLWKNDSCYYWHRVWCDLLEEIRYKTKIDDLTTIPLTEFLDLVNNTKVIYKDVRIYDKEHKETGRKTVVLEGNHIMKKFNEVYISEASGVYYLTFLRALVELFEVEAGTALGRGFQAGEYITVIHKHLGINKDDFGEVVEK